MCNQDMFTMGLKIIVTEMFKGGTDLYTKTQIQSLKPLLNTAKQENEFDIEKFKEVVKAELENYKKIKEDYNRCTKFMRHLMKNSELQELLEVTND